MNKIKTLQKATDIRYRPLQYLFMAIFLISVSSWSWQLYGVYQEVNTQMVKLSQTKSQLEEEQKQLKSEIERLNTPAYIEELARRELGMVRKGEIVISPKKSE